MLIKEVETIKPLTPDQARVKALKLQKDQATKALKVQQAKNIIDKGQKRLQQAQSTGN